MEEVVVQQFLEKYDPWALITGKMKAFSPRLLPRRGATRVFGQFVSKTASR